MVALAFLEPLVTAATGFDITTWLTYDIHCSNERNVFFTKTADKKPHSLVALLVALYNALNYELCHQDSSGTSMKMSHCYVTT